MFVFFLALQEIHLQRAGQRIKNNGSKETLQKDAD